MPRQSIFRITKIQQCSFQYLQISEFYDFCKNNFAIYSHNNFLSAFISESFPQNKKVCAPTFFCIRCGKSYFV